MTVQIECANCGDRHRMGDRTYDPEQKRMLCPECQTYEFDVRHDLQWHPEAPRI